MDTPVTSGSDLISNPGNANLGYSSGVGYGSNPAVTNPLEGVDNTLARIQQQDAAMRMQRHLEQRQDIEGLSQMLAQTNGSLFNMKDAQGNNVSFTPLPGDKKQLEDQADKLRKIVLNKPENYKNDPDFYKAKQALDYMTRHASVRSAFATQQNQLASAEQNPTERQRLIDNGKEQTGSDLLEYKSPVPLMSGPKFVDPFAGNKRWDDRKNNQEFGTTIEPRNGVDFEVKKYGKPTSELMAPLNDVSEAGITNATNGMNIWRGLPEAHNPDFINQMNSAIKTNAQDRGVPPVYEAWVNSDGSIQYNQNPRQWLTAHNLYNYGALSKDEKVSDASIKQAAEKENIENVKSQIADRVVKNKIAMDKAAKDDKPKYEAKNAALEVASTFSKYRNNTPKALDQQNVPELVSQIRTFNIDPANVTISRLNPDDQNIKEIAGAKKYNTAGVGQNDYETPVEAYYLRSKNGIEDDRIATKIPIHTKGKDKKGAEVINETYKWTFTAIPEAVGNKINYINRNNKSAQTPQAIDDAINTAHEALGISKKAKAPESEDDEAAVKARLKPITITKKDGTTIKALIDPVTNKKYAAE